MSRQKITAIVPVKKGSQRIKNKNLKKFAGKNLLKIKLEMLKKIDVIDNINDACKISTNLIQSNLN